MYETTSVGSGNTDTQPPTKQLKHYSNTTRDKKKQLIPKVSSPLAASRSRNRSPTPSSPSASRSRSISPTSMRSPSISRSPRRRRRSRSYSRSRSPSLSPSRSPSRSLRSSSYDSLASASSRSYTPPPRRRRRLNPDSRNRSRHRNPSSYSSDHSRSRSPPRSYRSRRHPRSRRRQRRPSVDSDRSSYSSRSSRSRTPPRRRKNNDYHSYRQKSLTPSPPPPPSSSRRSRRTPSPLPPRHRRHASPPRWRKRAPPRRDRHDRDRRTVFVSQLAPRVRERDVYKFFSKAGSVRDVRLILDRQSARHKGAGYVEFYEVSSVAKAARLDSVPLCGIPVSVRPSIDQNLGKDTFIQPGPSSPRKDVPLPIRDGAVGWRNRTPVRHVRDGNTVGQALPQQIPSASLNSHTKLVSIDQLKRLLNPNNLPPPNSIPLPTASGIQSNEKSRMQTLERVPLPTAAGANIPLNVGGQVQHSNLSNRLYIGSIPFHLKKETVEEMFRHFGKITSLELQMDSDGRSRGYGFIEFSTTDAAEKALEINGITVAGRTLKVAKATHENRTSGTNLGNAGISQVPLSGSIPDRVPLPGVDVPAEIDDGRDGGLAINPSQRVMLMQQLSGGENLGKQLEGDKSKPSAASEPTASLMLSNMFDPATEEPGFERELAEEVRDECASKYGVVTHLHVDAKSHGIVYIRFLALSSAMKAQNDLNGRWFGGKRVKAEFVGDDAYSKKFPKAAR